MAASLPIPIPAAPRSGNFIFLEEYQYLIFESRVVPERGVGLPLRQLQSGQRVAFVEPEVPIVTINFAAPVVNFSHKTGLFHRVVPYTAMLGSDGTSILIATDAAQTHRHGHYVVPVASIVELPPPTAEMPADVVTPLGGFTIDNSDEYSPKEDRCINVSWTPAAGVITRETLYQWFSSDDMVETISKGGELEARVTYRSPYSVASVLGGAETVRYGLGNGIPQMLVKCNKRKLEDSPDHRNHKVHITFDDPINYWELRNFFNRFGAVKAVTYKNVDGKPRGAVVFFQNPEAVRQTLRGAQVRTMFLDEREIRVRPYPTA